MIKSLEIENFILIDYQKIDFDKQINVLTGDTGSGKSVIINSIRFCIGTRANSNMYLDDTKNIKVTCTFEVTEKIAQNLKFHEIDFDDEVEVMRVLTPSGKNKIRVNGELVNLATVNDIFEDIITIYSQYSVAKFKSSNNYINIIDNLITDQNLISNYQIEYDKYTSLLKNKQNLESKALLKAERSELLSLRLTDLQNIDPNINIESLIEKKQALDAQVNNKTINENASMQLDIATKAITELINTLSVESHVKLLNDALINIDEVSYDVAKLNEPIDLEHLNQISEYISLCKRLSRKYNVSICDLGLYKSELEQEYLKLDEIDADIENVNSKLIKAYEKCKQKSAELNFARSEIIKTLADDVNEKLKQLSLQNSDFKIEIKPSELSKTGSDDINFLIMMNEGSKYLPIHTSASGGEVARFLLGLEAAISDYEECSFIIFDEIDTGVSGHVATEMAQMMSDIAKKHKILVVTHLAQVAAISENHFVVSKVAENGKTQIRCEKISDDEKPLRLAKMISGKELTKDATEHAKSLLQSVKG